MDFFHDSTALPGPSTFGHGRDGQSENPARGWPSALSDRQASLLSSFVDIARDPAAALAAYAGLDFSTVRNACHEEEVANVQRDQVLRARLSQAQTYASWHNAAAELDELEGKNAWKFEEASAEYNPQLLRTRLHELEETRRSGDQGRMILLLRTALSRNLGGMGNLRLYKHCRVGTKDLIDQYIESVLDTLNTLLDITRSAKTTLDAHEVYQGLIYARQAFGRSALLLSGGGTFGMNHIGVIKTLHEARLLPRIISGASAGSIVCSVLCTKTDEEIPGVLDSFCYGDLAVFEKEGEETSILSKAFRFFTKGALFDISHLIRVMRDLLGNITFQEAYNRTRRILNICVSTASLYDMPRLLNYITAPNVMIWSAVAASCSVPFIFSAAQLFAKDPRTGEQAPWNQSPPGWIDGSVDNDLPMMRLAEMFNVNHFIVSQVNPHVVPFLERGEEEVAIKAAHSNANHAAGPGWLPVLSQLAKSEALHRLQVLTELGVMPTAMSKLRSVLGQRYSGDITIFPKIPYRHFPKVLTNPTTDFMVECMLSGERATWPKMAEIRNHCAIELALDAAVDEMRGRAAFTPSQVHLRRLTSLENSVTTGQIRARRATGGSHHDLPSGFTHRLRPSPRRSRKSFHDLPSIVPIPMPMAAETSAKIAGPETESASSDLDSRSSLMAYSDDSTDDEDGGGDDAASFESPPSPQSRLWPSTRQLFPYASQPATPSIASRSAFASLATSPIAAPSGLAMTMKKAPIARPSSPELRYKRLFHHGGKSALATLRSEPSTPDAGPSPSSAAWPGAASGLGFNDAAARLVRSPSLEIDISGTRGMVHRRRRSQSTGIRGLRPPGRQ